MGNLNELVIRKSQSKEKAYKIADGGGLHLFVSPSGGKLWRLKYRHGGKEKLLSFGKYPAVSLTKARSLAAAAREVMASGVDPAAVKSEGRSKARQADAAATDAASSIFSKVAKTWYDEQSPQKNPRTAARWKTFIDYTASTIGHLPVTQIKAADLVRMVKEIDGTGKHETARRTFSTVGRILRYAVAHDLLERDPSRDVSLKDFLATVETRHHACLTDPKSIGGLLRAIEGYEGSAITRHALTLAALTFVRPGELRHAEWSEIDTAAAEWRIPAAKMKMGAIHIVPLSASALVTIEALRALTGGGRYLFPSERSKARPMSDNTVNAALRRMGYTKAEMTGHGFRGTASTRLHELGYRHQVIEIQLAHGERNEVAAAYNFAEYLPERRAMMQEWSEHLDELRRGAMIIPLVA